ncbi:hypothetical protein PG993_005331 [Apiospora rasikravindrae]|uniref:Uncharacterized protein n=1 Tax=Apiospora rasikravindrae TaxID=990691 RepID=A0ABR1TFX9_9PEZI
MIKVGGPVEVRALEGRELADVAVAEPVLGHGRRVGREPHARQPDDVLVPPLVAVARLRLRVVQIRVDGVRQVRPAEAVLAPGEDRVQLRRLAVLDARPGVVALLEEVGSIDIVVVLAPDKSIGSDPPVEVKLGLHHIKVAVVAYAYKTNLVVAHWIVQLILIIIQLLLCDLEVPQVQLFVAMAHENATFVETHGICIGRAIRNFRVLISQADRERLWAIKLEMDNRIEHVDPYLGGGVVFTSVGDMTIVDGQPLLEKSIPSKRVRVEGKPHTSKLEERVVLIESAALGNVEQDGP